MIDWGFSLSQESVSDSVIELTDSEWVANWVGDLSVLNK